MALLQTKRLALRELSEEDAPLMLAVLKDPDFLRNVGDRGVHTEEEARHYIVDGPVAMYRQHGFGMYHVALHDGAAIGLCGLVKRDGLDDVDIGFAFLSQFRGKGYALEAAQAVMQHGRENIALQRIVAIALPENIRSVQLLEKIGLHRKGTVRLPGDDIELLLLAWEARVE